MLGKLNGLRVAVPESRQLGVLKNLFEKRGAQVVACPLIAIHDSPQTEKVEVWLKNFIASPPDYFIILTGEGITRLFGFAQRAGLAERWLAALQNTFTIARGPKPNRALKPLGVQAAALAEQPTTDGMINSLDKIDLSQAKLSVQLYGENPNQKLQSYLQARSVSYDTVAPYIYASDIETEQVVALIQSMAMRELDMICFTSQPQYSRLLSVAKKHAIEDVLDKGLRAIKIAAVGPVVAEQITVAGYNVSFMPDEQFFMKPMVSAISKN